MLIFVAATTLIASYLLEGFGLGFLIHLSTTILLLCRLKAVRVKMSRFTVLEVLGLVFPALIALMFKRFRFFKTLGLVVVRGIFFLYVKYDYENYRYFTKTYTNYDDNMVEEEEEEL